MVADTHILIWDALSPQRLSQTAEIALSRASQSGELIICDISLWEIAMLISKGRIKVGTDTQSFLNLIVQSHNGRIVPISPQIASRSTLLPPASSGDPADRLILATAVVAQTPLITADSNLQANTLVPTIW